MNSEKERFEAHITEFRKNVFLTGDVELARRYVHDDVIDHFAPESDPSGIEGFTKRFASAQNAIKGLSIDVVASAYEDGLLFQAIRLNLHHTGDFMGIPASGRQFSIGGFDAFRFRDGKISEHWGVYDVSKIPDLLMDGADGPPGGWSQMWE